MSFGDDWLKNGLPVFNGGKDRTTARQMTAVTRIPLTFVAQTKSTLQFTQRKPSSVVVTKRGTP